MGRGNRTGKSGPPRRPTALKLVEGTYRADRAAKNEPKPEIEIPPCPPHLIGEARKEWDSITPELERLGLLSRIDHAALEAYCDAYGDYIDASYLCATKDSQDRKIIKTSEKIKHDKEGNVIERTGGNFMENPYFSIKKRCMEIMKGFLIEFGMTPAARSRINVLTEEGTGKKHGAKDKGYA